MGFATLWLRSPDALWYPSNIPISFMKPEHKDLLESAAYIVAIVSAFVAGAMFMITRVWPAWREWRNKHILRARVALESYSDQQIERATQYYLPPNCQQIDPAGHEESRALALVQERLFVTLNRELGRPADIRHLIVLADSGMGKTSAVLNYCARHVRSRRSSEYAVRVIHLGSPGADALIEATPDKSSTVLFLDALDEDTRAIADHKSRLSELLERGRLFRALVVTCRTQFFLRDEEIPRETGLIKSAPRAAGEKAEYLFHKLYLSPFTDVEVERYLRRRYPLWRLRKRMRAQSIVKQIPHLSVRPMLLAHIDDLLGRKSKYQYSFQLYEEMIDAWIERESGLVREPRMLLEFSQRLAINIYVNRERRGSERIAPDEIETLASDWGIRMDRWILTGRSLLNRDAEGFYKFAHRSIMEHLFVQSAMEYDADLRESEVKWTDQMLHFVYERIKVDRELPFKARLWEPGRDFLTAQVISICIQRSEPQLLIDCLSGWIRGLDKSEKIGVGLYYPDDKGLVLIDKRGLPSPKIGPFRVGTSLPLGSEERYHVRIGAIDRKNRDSVLERVSDLHRALGAQKINVKLTGDHSYTISAEY